MTPHIRALRAEGVALIDESRRALEAGRAAVEEGAFGESTVELTVASMLTRLSTAKFEAAVALEAEDAALKPPRDGQDRPITYNPKGKAQP